MMKPARSLTFSTLLVSLCLLITTGCSTIRTGQGTGISHQHNFITNRYDSPVLWDNYPLVVVIDRETPPFEAGEIIAAIERWNDAARTEIFLYEFGNESDSWLLPSATFITRCELGLNSRSQQTLGQTRRDYTLDSYNVPIRTRYARVCIWEYLGNEELYHVTLHELGHVLGLSHDLSDRSSIMFPHALEGGFQITPEDAQHVRFLGSLIRNPS